MENTALAMPLLDLFGEEVIIQRRSFERRPRALTVALTVEQMGFLDILEMSDEALEKLRASEEITDDYVDWLRDYLLKLTLRQILHPQVSDANWREAVDWLLSDENHPFSFKACCNASGADHEDVREGTLHIMRKHMK